VLCIESAISACPGDSDLTKTSQTTAVSGPVFQQQKSQSQCFPSLLYRAVCCAVCCVYNCSVCVAVCVVVCCAGCAHRLHTTNKTVETAHNCTQLHNTLHDTLQHKHCNTRHNTAPHTTQTLHSTLNNCTMRMCSVFVQCVVQCMQCFPLL
jgi:hypothetical protein